MRLAAVSVPASCVLFVISLAGCTTLLDLSSLSNGHGASGAGDDGGVNAGAGVSAGGSPSAAGSPAQGGSAESSSGGGSANGGTTTGMGGASAGAGGTVGMGGAGAGAGGDPCTKTNGGNEVCDGVDNDCDPATPDCPAGCTAFTAYGVNYMACDKLDDWNSAEFACIEQTMDLAQILSALENDAISAKLKELKFAGYVWIGGQSDPQNNTTFKWLNTTIIYENGNAVAGVYQNFASNQPASLGAPSKLEIEASAGTWSNAVPSTSQFFVCEARFK